MAVGLRHLSGGIESLGSCYCSSYLFMRALRSGMLHISIFNSGFWQEYNN